MHCTIVLYYRVYDSGTYCSILNSKQFLNLFLIGFVFCFSFAPHRSDHFGDQKMQNTNAKTKKERVVVGRGFIDLVFSWSIKDVRNNDLYKNQVCIVDLRIHTSTCLYIYVCEIKIYPIYHIYVYVYIFIYIYICMRLLSMDGYFLFSRWINI